MMKNAIWISIIICFMWCVASCGTTHVTIDHTREWQQTTVQDSSGKKTVQETKRKSTKVTVEAEASKKKLEDK